MKKIAIFILFIFTYHFNFAQTAKKASLVKSEVKSMSQGVKNAYVVEIPGVTQDDVEGKWKNLMDSYKAKPKWNRKDKEYFSEKAQIVEINGNAPIAIYAKIEGSGTSNVLLSVWFDLGAGDYLSVDKGADKYLIGEKIITEFSRDVVITTARKALDDEEKKYKKMEGKLKNLVDDKEDLRKSIDNYKAKIKKAEEDIIKNEQNQKEQQKNIEDQRDVIKKAQQKLDEVSKV